jgi:hypothetical protein
VVPAVEVAVDTAEGEQGMAMAAMTELPFVRVRASAVATALAVHDDAGGRSIKGCQSRSRPSAIANRSMSITLREEGLSAFQPLSE